MKMKNQNIYRGINSGLKTAAIIYVMLGNIVGVTDHLAKYTTGHVSSDIYLGKKKPTKLEKAVINFFDIKSTTKPSNSEDIR